METSRTVGRYRIDERLASGAMGEVYRAYDPLIDRPVAIKIIRRDLVGGGDRAQWLERFKREARAAGQRLHPNIVTVLDFGEEDGLPFLAMEFIDGPTLAGLMKIAGPLPPAQAAAIITQVLQGLGFAHQNGIIHRDIKPSNILVPANGPVKIADFGIARTDSSDLTVVGDLLGTPAYVAPEQLRGDPIDNRSDLFATGVMFFEALTGVKPFRAKTLAERIALMKTRGPEELCALNPLIPKELQPVLDQALAFDPVRRFASAIEFSRAIGAAMASDPGMAAAAQAATPRLAAALPSPSDRSIWRAELLRRIERELASFIGPLASLAVKQASRATSDLGALNEALSQYIDNDRDRRRFLQTVQALAAPATDSTGSSWMVKSAGGAPRAADGATPLPSLADLAELETTLTRMIGPIAKILLKRHLRNFETLPQLYQTLAANIPNERDRAAFLELFKSG